jgi:hypothetical protein
MNFRETGTEILDWMHLAQDIDQWWAAVSTAMKFPSINGG